MEATPSPARKPGAVVVPHPVDARKAENAKLDAAARAAYRCSHNLDRDDCASCLLRERQGH